MSSLVLLLTGLLAVPQIEARGSLSESDAALVGRWRLSITLPITQKAPVVGDLERRLELSAIVDVRAEDGGLVQSTTACDVDISGGNALARVEVPDRFADAIQIPSTPLRVKGEQVNTRLSGVHLGYRPEREGARAPTSATDPSVYDADRDQNPGVTVLLRVLAVGEVELFVVQKLSLELQGQAATPDRHEGLVRVLDFEQNLLASKPSFSRLKEELRTTADDGRFILERVAPTTTCATP